VAFFLDIRFGGSPTSSAGTLAALRAQRFNFACQVAPGFVGGDGGIESLDSIVVAPCQHGSGAVGVMPQEFRVQHDRRGGATEETE
jgi:hypothetical protein